MTTKKKAGRDSVFFSIKSFLLGRFDQIVGGKFRASFDEIYLHVFQLEGFFEIVHHKILVHFAFASIYVNTDKPSKWKCVATDMALCYHSETGMSSGIFGIALLALNNYRTIDLVHPEFLRQLIQAFLDQSFVVKFLRIPPVSVDG
jgi:hypothetical protein